MKSGSEFDKVAAIFPVMNNTALEMDGFLLLKLRLLLRSTITTNK